jgi:hypothetical protein
LGGGHGREIVNIGDHLTTLTSETSCSGWDLGMRIARPAQYCTAVPNMPKVFRGVVAVIVCAVAVLGTAEMDGAVRSDVGGFRGR